MKMQLSINIYIETYEQCVDGRRGERIKIRKILRGPFVYKNKKFRNIS